MKKLFFLIGLILIVSGCAKAVVLPTREESIPKNMVKIMPVDDVHPPILHSKEFAKPIPVENISTAGAEDSPFIDGDRMFFFFTPDPNIPIEKQLFDNVTGIYVSKKTEAGWGEIKRVLLTKPGKLAMDGCEFSQGDTLWFCSAREGYTGMHWFTAQYKNGQWQNWKNADFDPAYEVGELHISKNGETLYFHSPRKGGKGNLDIWVSQKKDGRWQEPTNLSLINSPENDGWPYLSPDEKELWFLRNYFGTPAIFRSRLVNGAWQNPELIVSQFAGEPTLDNEGNLYFVHHYYKDSKMLEADIYVAKKK